MVTPESGNKKRGYLYDNLFFGAGKRIRTADLLITNQLPYLLGHTSEY